MYKLFKLYQLELEQRSHYSNQTKSSVRLLFIYIFTFSVLDSVIQHIAFTNRSLCLFYKLNYIQQNSILCFLAYKLVLRASYIMYNKINRFQIYIINLIYKHFLFNLKHSSVSRKNNVRMNLEEYEPESNQCDNANSYVPTPVENPIENDEYEPELDNTNGESNYTPAIDVLAKNYVNIYNGRLKKETSVKGEEDASSSSSSDEEFEFTPVSEQTRNKNALTEEEKQNYGYAFAKHDLTPESLPTAPDVSGIIVPPQLKMIELGAVEKVMENPTVILIIQSKLGKYFNIL